MVKNIQKINANFIKIKAITYTEKTDNEECVHISHINLQTNIYIKINPRQENNLTLKIYVVFSYIFY